MPQKLPISVCLIVKNEEAYLDACLKSVKDWVNEIIVVDTGSTDRTVEIAKENGAKVSYFEWIGDFAAARNESLSLATNPFILQLDADEEIISSSIEWFRSEYPYNEFDGYYTLLHNLRDASSDEVLVSHRLIRFFRNHPDIRFKNKIHENIMIPTGKTSLSKIEILHKGYGKEINSAAKTKRNMDLLLANLKENPYNPYTHYYLSQSFSALGKTADAYKACMKSLKLGINFPVRSHVYRVVFMYLANNKKVEDFERMERTIVDHKYFPEITFYKALLLNKLNHVEESKRMFLDFIEMAENPSDDNKIGDENFIVVTNYVSALTNIAVIEHNEKNINLSLNYLYKALELSPMSTYLYSMIARSEVMRNNKLKAIEILETAITIFDKQLMNLQQKDLISEYQRMIIKIRESV
jgi:glycosyltransferase involved in cell wall biosynthesis